MTSIGHFLTSSLAESIGWTVIHSFWQAMVLVFLYQLIIIVGKPKKARQKYNLAFGTFLSQLLLTIATWSLLYQPQEINLEAVVGGKVVPLVEILEGGLVAQNILEQIQLFIVPYLSLIVSIWIVGMAFFLLRLLIGYSFWYRLKNTNVMPVSDAWQGLFDKMKNKMGIRNHVNVGISTMITSPILIGHFKPLILLPFTLVNQLTTAQVEAIIAHELAHLRRFDFILNFIQLLIESIFYYHPAIWWLSKEIRSIREECADDMALAYTNDSIIYAKTLLTVAEQSNKYRPSLAMSLLGQNKQQLLTRIQRILQQPVKQPDMREKIAITSLLLCMAVAISLGAAWSSPTTDWVPQENVQLPMDTIPMGRIHIKMDDNGGMMEVSLEDGRIERLSINGKEIPSTEFSKYEAEVTEMLANVPPPPPPPPAPKAPRIPNAVPPPPPPPHEFHSEQRRMTKIDEDGHRYEIIIEKDSNGETRHTVIDHNGKGERVYRTEHEMKTAERALEMEEREMEMVERRFEMEEREMERVERRLEEEHHQRERVENQEERRFEIAEQRVEQEERRMLEQEERVEVRAERELHHRVNKNQWLEQELLGDGLIDDENNYSFKLNSKRLKINGKNVSDALHQKYMNLYEERQGENFSKNSSISIAKKNN